MITVICVSEHKWTGMAGGDFEVAKPWVSVPALPPFTRSMTSGKGHLSSEEEDLTSQD